MRAADKAVCCSPAAACLRLPTNAAATTDAPHQMSLQQILLPLTLQELILLPRRQNCRQSNGGGNIFKHMFLVICMDTVRLNSTAHPQIGGKFTATPGELTNLFLWLQGLVQ